MSTKCEAQFIIRGWWLRHRECHGTWSRKSLAVSTTTTMTSEWLVPSTRSEVIEDLVSGVGQSL